MVWEKGESVLFRVCIGAVLGAQDVLGPGACVCPFLGPRVCVGSDYMRVWCDVRVGARFLLVLHQPGPCAACAVVSCGAMHGVGMIVDCCVCPVFHVVSVPGDAGDGSIRGR